MTWFVGFVVLALMSACGSGTPSAVSEHELRAKRPPSTADSSLLRFEISAEAASEPGEAASRISIQNVSSPTTS
jgi:hypothetical protein